MGIKEFFQSEWAGVAPAWHEWQVEARLQSAAATAWIIELAHVRPGLRVLDLASGVGEPALELARHVGPSGRVVATDLVAGPLAVLDRSASAAGLTWLETRVADMERLPFEDATFDAVTCRLGLMFCPQPQLALAEARRVLQPGGRAAFVVWGSREQPLFASTLGVLAGLSSGTAEPVPADAPGPFRFAAHGSLTLELQRAGFSAVREAERTLAWPLEGTAERFWQMFCDLAGPTFRAAIGALEADQRRVLSERIRRELDGFQHGNVIDPTASLIGCVGAQA